MDETSEQALERLLCGVGDARVRLSEALQEQKPLLHERLREVLPSLPSPGSPSPAQLWRQSSVRIEASVFGIVSQLAAQLSSGRWSHLVQGMAGADPLAALLVWRAQRPSRSLRLAAPYLGCAESPASPPLPQVRRAAAHAFAVYGTLADAFGRRGAGLGDFSSGLRQSLAADAHAEAAAAAAAADIPPSCILHACWVPSEFNPVAYVALDEAAGWVVLAIRGTLSGHDTLTDACATPAAFPGGFAHAGMAAAAWQVARTHLPAAAAALAAHPGSSLLLTGHSMGGGVAALVTALCLCGDADVESAVLRGALASGAQPHAVDRALACVRAARCVAFACPAVTSLGLAHALRRSVTAVVAGKDLVPRLSLASVQRLTWRLGAAWRPVGNTHGAEAESGPEHPALWRRGATEMRDLGAPDCLVPAGLCLHLRGLSSAAPRCEVRSPAAFSDLRLGVRMFSDHRCVETRRWLRASSRN